MFSCIRIAYLPSFVALLSPFSSNQLVREGGQALTGASPLFLLPPLPLSPFSNNQLGKEGGQALTSALVGLSALTSLDVR